MKPQLLYSELSYSIIGILFEAFNQLQYGHREKVYQKAINELLSKANIPFKKEVYYPIKINNKIISRYYLDFLIDDKIVLEIKVANDFYQKDVNQLLSYIKFKGYRLGILALFTKTGIRIRRLIN